MLLTVGVHLGNEQSLFLWTEPIFEVQLIAIATLQEHFQCVADAATLQIVVGVDVQPVIVLGGADIGT